MDLELRKLKRVVIKEELVALTQNVTEAIILNQLLYWSERVKDFDMWIEQERARAQAHGEDVTIDTTAGWIYKTADELSEETMLGISKQNMRLHIKKLVKSGWIEERTNPKYKWDKTKQYRVNLFKIQKDLEEIGYYLEGYILDIPQNSPDNNLLLDETKNKLPDNNLELYNEQIDPAIPEITTNNKLNTIVTILHARVRAREKRLKELLGDSYVGISNNNSLDCQT